jgi:2-methylthioadenine synthetase
MEEQSIISREINRSRIGELHEVLIEGRSDLSGFPLVGRIRAQAPDVDGVTYVKTNDAEIGDIITCRIIEADVYDLFARETENGKYATTEYNRTLFG